MNRDFLHLVQFKGSKKTTAHASAQENEDDRLVEFLRSLHKNPAAKDRRVGFATGILVATASNRVRNAAAVALADIGARNAAGSIVEVLRRTEIAKASGTLLYALCELEASIPLDVLVGLIENGSYEGRATALTFLDDNRIERPSDDEINVTRRRLANLIERGDDPEGVEAAELALEYLDAQAQPETTQP